MRFRSERTPKIDGYDRLDEIGRGGFSRVYTAHQLGFDRRVALKVITAHVDDDGLGAFRREQRIMGRLDGHPNIVRVYDAGVSRAGQPYLAMEYLAEGTIADRLRRRGPFAVSDALHIAVVLGCAIDAAHEQGVVHRDVKPQNVLWSPFVGPVLADFGIAGVLGDHRTDPDAFSVLHAAPEVLAGGPATAAADVYSVASTVYELLAGRAPFHDPAAPAMPAFLERARTGEIPPIGRHDLPAEADAAIVRLLEGSPDARPSTGLDLASRIRSIQIMLGLDPTPFVGESPTASLRLPPSAEPPVPAPAPPPLAVPAGPDTVTPPEADDPASLRELLDAHSTPRSDAAPVRAPTPVAPPQTPRARTRPRVLQWSIVLSIVAVAIVGITAWAQSITAAPPDAVTTAPLCPAPMIGSVEPPPQSRAAPAEFDVVRDGADVVLRFTGDGDAATTYVVYLRCRAEAGEASAVTPLATIGGGEPTEYRIADAAREHEWCLAVGVVEPGGGSRLGSPGSQFRCI